jgi:hypothetical protein
VRGFIQADYAPYEGDDAFLAGPTERTAARWRDLSGLFAEERRRGILNVAVLNREVLLDIKSWDPATYRLVTGGEVAPTLRSVERVDVLPFLFADTPTPDVELVDRVRAQFTAGCSRRSGCQRRSRCPHALRPPRPTPATRRW